MSKINLDKRNIIKKKIKEVSELVFLKVLPTILLPICTILISIQSFNYQKYQHELQLPVTLEYSIDETAEKETANITYKDKEYEIEIPVIKIEAQSGLAKRIIIFSYNNDQEKYTDFLDTTNQFLIDGIQITFDSVSKTNYIIDDIDDNIIYFHYFIYVESIEGSKDLNMVFVTLDMNTKQMTDFSYLATISLINDENSLTKLQKTYRQAILDLKNLEDEFNF